MALPVHVRASAKGRVAGCQGTNRGERGRLPAANAARSPRMRGCPNRDLRRRLPPLPALARSFEVGFWVLLIGSNCIGNSITTLMEIRRRAPDTLGWEPAVWEASSALMWLLVLLPAIAWFTRRFPLHWDNWRRRLPWYLLASVAGFAAARGRHGGAAHAGLPLRRAWTTISAPGARELLYEYLKDIRSFASIVVMMEGYRFVLRRWQGEASLLDAPDEGPPVEPVELPERFLVRKLGREFLVAANDIEWIQASGNYVNLRVRSHDYPLRSTIAGIETSWTRAASPASTAATWSTWTRSPRSSRWIPAMRACT